MFTAKSDLFFDFLKSIEQLYSIGSNKDFNLILIYEGVSAGKFTSEFRCPAVYYIDKERTFSSAFPHRTFPKSDMTKQKTLVKIFKSIYSDFPAQHIFFQLKGHGTSGGVNAYGTSVVEKIVSMPKGFNSSKDKKALDKYIIGRHNNLVEYIKPQKLNGVYANNKIIGLFSRNKALERLEFTTISTALTLSFPKKIDILFLECCWGMQIETAFTFSKATNYFIASQDQMPATSDHYIPILKSIMSKKDISAPELSGIILRAFYTYNFDDYAKYGKNSHFKRMGVSLTVADLEYINVEKLVILFNELCNVLLSEMDFLHEIIQKARHACRDFTYYLNEDVFGIYNIDLIWFLENLIFHNTNANYSNQLKLVVEISADNLIKYLLIYLRKDFFANNYKKAIIGKNTIVSRGFSISFPKSKSGFIGEDGYTQTSENRRAQIPFYKKTQWINVLTAYFKKSNTVNQSTRK